MSVSESNTDMPECLPPRWKWILGVVSFAVFGVILYMLAGNGDAVRSTRTRLAWNRALIQQYHRLEGRYPDSLAELAKYCEKKDASKRVFLDEHLSDSHGLTRESTVLDGEGGWYYNNETGELRVNLTKPLKHYAPVFWDSSRNQPPAEW